MEGIWSWWRRWRKAALETIQNRKILDTVKNNKDRNVSNSELLNNLNSGDGVKLLPPQHFSLSENKAISIRMIFGRRRKPGGFRKEYPA